MEQSILDKAKFWTSDLFDEDTRNDVQLLIDSDPKELEESFYKDLEFGTGGLRGIMGPGTNRINIYTISMATQGLANYINQVETSEPKSVAIAHDCRINSHVFARKAAEVLSANGIKAYLFSELRPTPELSFAVRHFGCTSGIVITASHNPKEYNGYKVYWNDGGQIVAPHDKAIIEEVRKVAGPQDVASEAKSELIEIIGQKVDEAYRETLSKEFIHLDVIERQKNMPLVFSPIHGTGITQIPEILSEMGFENTHIVDEQSKPDGNFPTVHSPNPEEQAALDLGLKLSDKVGAEILMATDPDADRVGIAVRDLDGKMVLLNGNETASMLTYYLLSQHKAKNTLPENGFVCRTIVTTELIDKIANEFNVNCYSTLTGFKYIAEQIRNLEGKEKFIGGGEESYGYMIGDSVRDKDAVITGAMLCEVAAWAKDKGSSFYKELIEVYIKFGLYREALVSLVKKGRDGAEQISQIMKDYRTKTPLEIAGSKVAEMHDYESGLIKNIADGSTMPTGLPSSNVVQFYLEDGSKITARPSGTEPKIKFYFSLNAKIDSVEDYLDSKNKLEQRIEELKDAFVNG